jgi:predicted methyltransferase
LTALTKLCKGQIADDAARKPGSSGLHEHSSCQISLELEGGRGWYSRLLSEAIGPSGKLYAQYPPEFGRAYKGRQDAGHSRTPPS